MELKDKVKSVTDFFKEAYCVDGEVKFVSGAGFEIDAVIELNDSKRGKFYMASVSIHK